MSAVISALWSYAGWSMRENEGHALDAARARRLKQDGWAYVELLLVDGETLVNRQASEVDVVARNALANGLPLVCWATPRPQHVPVERTVELAAEAVRRYGCAAVRYQTEAEFEYSNAAGGGTPATRYTSMQALGEAHDRFLRGVPASIYTRGSLERADAYWLAAWRYGLRPGVEIYGVNETPVAPGVPPRPDFAVPAAKESCVPQLTAGWSYRVRIGQRIVGGRITDDGGHVQIDDGSTYALGSAAGPRYISHAGNPKWGVVLGFFPGSWIKPVISPYPNPQTAEKPSGSVLAEQVTKFLAQVRKHGQASKGYAVWAGAEMAEEHYVALAPKALGASLLP